MTGFKVKTFNKRDLNYGFQNFIIFLKYYRLSKQYHPDVNNEANSTDKFKEIQAAYHVIGDEQRKIEYDRSMRPMAYESRNSSDRANGGNPFQSNKKLIIYEFE